MKIAYIVPGLDPTGPIIVVRNLILSLVNTEHQIDLFYLKKRERVMDFPCKVYKIDKNTPIDFDSYDIIHSHCYSADCYVKKWRKCIRKAKTVTTIHQDTIASFKFIYPFPMYYIFGRHMMYVQDKLDGIVAISKQVKDVHQRYYSHPIKIIYNGINFVSKDKCGERFNIQYINVIKEFKKGADILLGTFANIVKRKGISQIFKIMAMNPNYKFIIIGDGPYKNELVKECETFGISDKVLFLPFVEHPYLYLEEIDVYCMPSYSEGFGLALLEAAYAGKAIVCSDIPSFHELFTNEVVFFTLNDTNSLSTAISKANADKEKFGEMAKRRAQYFTQGIMTNNYLTYYKELKAK